MDNNMKQSIMMDLLGKDAKVRVLTDPAASPTGFPFKVLQLEDGQSLKTLSDPQVYEARPRACNLGYLRAPYLREDGKVGYRCPAECVEDFVSKGGNLSETVGRKCLCNALCADAGFPQSRYITNPVTREKELYVEPGLVTIGDDVKQCIPLIKKQMDGTVGYSAAEVMDYLMSDYIAQEMRTSKRKEELVNPVRWGYSASELADYLISEFDTFHTQVRENAELVMV